MNVGVEGVLHFYFLMNTIIKDINLSLLSELNSGPWFCTKAMARLMVLTDPTGPFLYVLLLPRPLISILAACINLAGQQCKKKPNSRVRDPLMSWLLYC